MKRLLTLVLAVIAMAACTQSDFKESVVDQESALGTLTVSFEGNDETRIQLDSWSGKTVWNANDEVSVFYRSMNNTKWVFTGNDGDRTGNLSHVSGNVGANTMGKIIIAYPYNANYRLNPSQLSLDIYHSAVQHYKYRSYGEGGNVMVACSDFTNFQLRSVCGWLRLEIEGNGERVESILFRGNNGEQIAGLAYVNAETAEAVLASESSFDSGNDSEVGGNILFDDSVLKEIMLDCGEGVTLGSEPTQFYIALLPQHFEAGITVEINCFDGSVMELSSSSPMTIERNHIQPMAKFTYTGEIPPIYELNYTTDDGKPVSLYSEEGFGGNLIENRYDATTGKGTLVFDAQITAIPDSAFLACNNLTSIDIPDGIQSIGKNAFNGCNAIKEISIPKSITSIGSKAFYGCTGRATINCRIEDNWNDGWFREAGFSEVVIDNNITSVGCYAFYNCDNLTKVTIGERVERIRYDAFASCDNLQEVTLPVSVKSIESSAFDYCENLSKAYYGGTESDWWAISFSSRGSNPIHHGGDLYIKGEAVKSMTVPSAITSLGYQLSGISFEEVTLHNDITEITNEAFRDCDALLSVTIPDKVAEIKSSTFYGCDALERVVLGSRVTNISGEAFRDCRKLKSVYFPTSLTNIDDRAFYCCESLEEAIFNEGLTSIGYDAFSECHSITKVVLPSTIVRIENYAFNHDSSLKEVYCKAGVVPAGGREMFNGSAEDRKIYVPVEVMYDYRAAEYWKDYAEYIFGYDFENDNLVVNIFEIAYKTNDGEPLDPYTTEGFGANFLENIFDAATGEGVLKFDSRVTAIPERAFVSCTNLTWLDIPECITYIGSEAFKSCTSMQEITIPSSVTRIDDNAFSGCTGKATINCNGTEDDYQWNDNHLRFRDAAFSEVVIGDSVTTIDSDAFSGCKNLKSVTIGNNVTIIEWSAFYNCGALTTITLPKDIATIYGDAFSGCISLSKVYFSGDIGDWLEISFGNSSSNPLRTAHDLYINNELVTDVVIPESVTVVGNQLSGISAKSITMHDNITEIADSAFEGCLNLESATIPSRVLRINYGTFRDCKVLKSVVIGKRVTAIGESAFNGCAALSEVEIPNSVITIENDAFRDCISLTAIDIPNSVTSIGWYAFAGCTRLCDLTIGNGVATIESYAFENCQSLTEVVIPEGVTYIGSQAFRDCRNLTSVTIPTTLSEVGYWAFTSNDSLDDIYISDLSAWCRISFGSDDANPLYFGVNLYLNGKLVTDLIIPEGVTSIGNYAFIDCNCLTSVTIPNSVTAIGKEAFRYCQLERLTLDCNIPNGMNQLSYFDGALSEAYFKSVVIGDSVTEIGDYAFSGFNRYWGDYSQLQTIYIGKSVENIGEGAFNECTNLTELYVHRDIPPTLESGNDLSAATIYVPAPVVAVYKSAEGWKEFADKIEGYYFDDTIAPTLQLAEGSPELVELGPGETSRYVGIVANVEYEVIIPSDVDWISVYKTNKGQDYDTITLSIKENPTLSARSATVTFQEVGGTLSTSVTFNQSFFAGIDDSSLDPNKYLTYVANRTSTGYGDLFDYNIYITNTYFEATAKNAVIAEYKFKLPEGTTSAVVADDVLKIGKTSVSVLSDSYREDGDTYRDWTTYDLAALGISNTDVLTIRLDSTNDTATINGHTVSNGNIMSVISSHIFSTYYRDFDDGEYKEYGPFVEDARLYYVKAWDSYGRLVYLGHADKATNSNTGNIEACWKSQDFNGYSVYEEKTFANYKSEGYKPLGMGNM